ncbi:2-hydroxyacyl-CoA dehydratase subunit D [Moorella sp. Hama-1]|uniref:2-hydroxyacyl-CoA dehydratase subunit D n=1 Tax=Moorella sp. Hama-1 TaxID=2138101 RepID=UPI000D647ACB|nr:2-hydroxyacyl-CoA dehydratase family protein [Moorella sp. Hama-1]BCV21084.1 2-hydroxyglutaryl-CoA dehydratase [Moorella sp. Hama-1]
MSHLMGWLCHYTPVEILTALGYTPYRLLGREGNNPRATTYLLGNLCPYVQSCLEAAIRQELPPLDGVVIARSCNAMIHLANVWPHYGAGGKTIVLDVPRRLNEDAIFYFSQNLRQLAVEAALAGQQRLDEKRLWAAITWWEEQRTTWRRLLTRRAAGEEPPAGKEIIEGLSRWQTSPNLREADKLEEVITRPAHLLRGKAPSQPRLLLVGSILPWELITMVEECGGLSVFEDSCNGRRLLLNPTTTAVGEGDPYLYLARLYLESPPCPRMVSDREKRRRYWAAIVDQFPIQGIIYHVMKFCDAALYDFLDLKVFCEKRELPLLRLDGDFSGGNRGQWQTRLEAFLEMLEVR